ncbi:MAG: rhomboid family intramembrane serine protease [Candidatus Omnitrophota bacterium]
MRCPNCSNELEIFAKESEEVYVCPLCLSVLLLQESSVKILKHFCKQEVLNQLISNILDESVLRNTKEMLKAADNLACPNCKTYTKNYDFNGRLNFFANKCPQCGAIWLNSMQVPLVSIAFIENNPDDLNFKRNINNLYEILVHRRSIKPRSLDEIIAPFLAIPLSVAGAAFPISDNITVKTRSYATKGIIVTCSLIFLLDLLLIDLVPTFSLIADKVLISREWYRLITNAFLHGGIFHLLGNMWFLWVFGRSVEDRLGWNNYLFLFVLGAIFSAVLFIATTNNKSIPCVGASGTISAIIGAYLILFPKAKLRFDIYRPLSVFLPVPIQKIATTQISSMYYVLFWIIMNVFFAMLQSGSKTVGIAYWGHIGGFIAGIIFTEVYKNFRPG